MTKRLTKDDGGFAFPTPDSVDGDGNVQYGSNGMKLRAYIASRAMQGILSNPEFDLDNEEIINFAVQLADDLINKLNTT